MSGWLLDLLILLGVLAIVVIAGVFLFNQFAASIPDPFRKILIVVLVVIAAVIAIMILLQLRGGTKFSQIDQRPQIGAMIPAVPAIMVEERRR